jgi:hypothetical protein
MILRLVILSPALCAGYFLGSAVAPAELHGSFASLRMTRRAGRYLRHQSVYTLGRGTGLK